jgi:hypothetical protein
LGLPIAWKDMSTFSTLRASSTGIIATFDRVPHPNARSLFINWLLSPEAWAARQKLIADGVPGSEGFKSDVSLRTDVSNEHVPPELRIDTSQPFENKMVVADPKFTEKIKEAEAWIEKEINDAKH